MADRYWVGGTATWDTTTTTNWSTTSGGAGGASAPTSADRAIFDANSNVGTGAFTVTIAAGGAACQILNIGQIGTVPDGVMTLAGSGPLTVTTNINYGSALNVGSNLVVTYSGTITMGAGVVASAIATTLSPAITWPCNIVYNSTGGTLTHTGNFALSGSFTLTAGTVNLQTFTLSCGTFSSSNANTRALTFGVGGNIIITGNNATVFNMATVTGFTYTGTSAVNFTYSGSTGTRTISSSLAEANSLNFNISAGTDTVSVNGGNSINFTGFSGTLANTACTMYGSLTLVSAMTLTAGINTLTFAATSGTKTITTAGETLDFPVTFGTAAGATFTLQDAFTMGSTRTLSLTGGTLNLNNLTLTTGFVSSGSGFTRALTFGTGKIVVIGLSGTVFYMESGTPANFSYTGTPTLEITNASGANRTITFQGTTWTGSNTLSVSVTTGSDIVTMTSPVLNLSFTGFTGTWTGGSAIIYGNLTLGSGMSTTSSASLINFAAGSDTKTITTAGVTINFPIQIGPNTPQSTATWQLQDALTMLSTRKLNIYNGNFDTNSNTVTCGIFDSSIGNAFTRTIATGTSSINITGNNATVLTMYYTGVTYTGSMIFNLTYSGGTGTRTVSTGSGAETTSPNVYITAGTDTVSVTGSIINLDFTGFGAGILTCAATTIYGNLYLSSSMTTTSSTNVMTFASTSGTETLTTNGVTINFPMTFNGVGGTWQLQDALTLLNSRTVTLTNGTLNLNNKSLTAGLVSSSGAATRVLTIGTGTITITGNAGTVWAFSNVTGLTVTGNQIINFTYSGSTGTRSIESGITAGTEANAFSFNFTAGSDILSISTSSKIDNLDFTSFSGTVQNLAITIYGNFILSSTMTITAGNAAFTFAATSGAQQIFSAGITVDRPFTVNGVGGTFQLGENLTLGTANGTLTLTNGTIDLNSKVLSVPIFSSTNSNARTLAFGTGTINLTGSGSIVIWDTTTLTNFTTTGTQTINCTSTAGTVAQSRTISGGSTGATESNVFSFNITAGIDIIVTTSAHSFKNLNFTGFSGTLNNTTRTIYGDLTLSSTMTCATGSNASTFAATSGTKLITTNGITTDFPFTFNGAGGTWQLVGNLTMATVTNTFTITTGTFNTNGYNVTIGLFSSANSNTRALNLGSGTWNILGSGATAWNLGTTTGMTLTPGTATIDMSSASAKTFVGGGLTYPILNQGGAGTLTITGSNTFNTIKNTTQPATVSFTAATTTTVTNFMLSGTSGNLITIGSVTAASHTISVPVGTVTVNFCTISRSTATGGATFRAPTSNGCVDGLNNSGWVFTALGNPVGTMLSFFS